MSTTDHIAEKKEQAVLSPRETAPATKKSFQTTLWVNTTYFAEGLPYMIVRIISTVFFTDLGIKERYLGYLNFLAVPWNLKFLWSPLLDIFSTKRRWLITLQFLISLLTMAIAVTAFFLPSTGDTSRYVVFIVVIFVGMAFLSATNDIAIDAYYLEGLTDKGDQALYSGYRIMAYRIAMIFARSGLVALVAIIAAQMGIKTEQNPNPQGAIMALPWAYALAAGGLTMFLIALFHAIKLPQFERKRVVKEDEKKETIWNTFGRAFSTYLQQERIALVLAFIILYKIGDEILFSMTTPFLKRELGITNEQYAWVGGIVGAACVVLGAMVGGWWIKRQGLKKAIWPLTILMNFNIWAYIWLAYIKPDPKTTAGIAKIAFVHGYEQLAAGLGSAALLIYLLRTCKPDFKAAHYAIGSAIMTLGGTLFGGFGGQIVEKYGYLNLFILAFFASIPSMLLLFWVPLKDEQKK
jgi:MFS transporter, PAT family, beta-lactamase induction signal transducer AmpG